MSFQAYTPAPPLDRFVKTIWHHQGYTQPHAKERLMPDGALAIVINLAEDCTRLYDRNDHNRCTTLSGSSIVGPRSEHFIIDTAEQLLVIGVQFRPGGAAPFLRMPVDAIQDLHLSLEDVWGKDARSLRARLLDEPSPQVRCRILEQELLRRSHGRIETDACIHHALRQLGTTTKSVADIVSETGYSATRFTNRFRSSVGLTPKTYSRIRRFQGVLQALHLGHDFDWTDLALSAGYFDQAHFIHDFRGFSGINPTTYVRSKTPHLNHVPILD